MGIERLIFLFVLPLTACGEMGLTAFGPGGFDSTGTAPAASDAPTDNTETATDTGLWDDAEADEDELEEEEAILDTGTDDLKAPISGTTWAMAFDDVRVLSPMGIDFRWNEVDAQSLLFHITGETQSSLAIVSTLSLADGNQDACKDVVPLPDADWSANPVLALEGAKLGMQLAGQFVQLEDVAFETIVSEDHTRWDDIVLVGTANALQFEGGLVPPTTDICSSLAEHDNPCFECTNGQPTCFTLEIGSQALLSDIDFSTLTDHQIGMMLEMAGLSGGDLPSEEGAELNEILDALPPEVTDRMLTIYYNRLSRYRQPSP